MQLRHHSDFFFGVPHILTINLEHFSLAEQAKKGDPHSNTHKALLGALITQAGKNDFFNLFLVEHFAFFVV